MKGAARALVPALLAIACTPGAREGQPLPEPRTRAEAGRCASHEPLRQAFFGDLHVHTSWSMDAFVFGTTTTPDDAYRFAQGATLDLPGGGITRLERPLDFAAVTEHAEFIGEVVLCLDAYSDVYELDRCKTFRNEIAAGDGQRMSALTDARGPFAEVPGWGRFGWRARAPDLCGRDARLCREASRSVWMRLQEAAARWQDPSEDCRFTTFNAYEWSWSPQLSKVHRNVIFRNESVPDVPLSAIEYDHPDALFAGLQRECIDAGTGCDVLTIPHNPNLSDGRLLSLEELPSIEAARELARRRAALEPLVEILQVKGDSECRNGLPRVLGSQDERCDFEKLREPTPPVCGPDNAFGAIGGLGCVTPLNYVRYALIEGLRQHARLGVNPLKLGITASTDAHNANPGDTEEFSFTGGQGRHTATPTQRLASDAGFGSPLRRNPGGLTGVWAEENSRDALFDAMRRRETFGTSGTRIRPRLYGAWEMDDALCGWPDHVERADALAVPMGADLPRRPAGAGPPILLASALRDPGSPLRDGNRLERIEIVKGWAGPEGSFHQAVYDVAVARDTAEVDPRTCEVGPGGEHGLCGVWQDPDFDPAQHAVYYARVIEVPSCRWSTWECNRLPERKRPATCSDPEVPTTVQERAWTSPIWYTPS